MADNTLLVMLHVEKIGQKILFIYKIITVYKHILQYIYMLKNRFYTETAQPLDLYKSSLRDNNTISTWN